MLCIYEIKMKNWYFKLFQAKKINAVTIRRFIEKYNSTEELWIQMWIWESPLGPHLLTKFWKAASFAEVIDKGKVLSRYTSITWDVRCKNYAVLDSFLTEELSIKTFWLRDKDEMQEDFQIYSTVYSYSCLKPGSSLQTFSRHTQRNFAVFFPCSRMCGKVGAFYFIWTTSGGEIFSSAVRLHLNLFITMSHTIVSHKSIKHFCCT